MLLWLVGDDGKVDFVCLLLLCVVKEGGVYVSLFYVLLMLLILLELFLGRCV